jgi:hypothetical protein
MRILSGSLSTRKREIVVLGDGIIRFVDVGVVPNVWPRTIHIGQVRFTVTLANKTPRRLYFDTKMQRIVVACSNIER